MDIEQLENKYADLKRAFDDGQLSAPEFQASVDDLRTQDDFGRYWVIGAETGAWYYFDGVEWSQADPRQADSLPVVDEQGVYWMLGRETNEWYYYDGEAWVRPPEPQPQAQAHPAPAAEAQAQYYQDDEGRYWAKGAKSGQWYFYDETGWHSADELEPPPPAPDPYQPGYAQAAPVQAVPPAAEQVYRPPQPQPPDQGFTRPVVAQPQPQPQPQPAAAAPAPEPQPVVDHTHSVTPQPQPQPQQPAQAATPAGVDTEAGVWYYFDGEQWLRFQEPPQPQPEPIRQETSLPQEQLEAGVWYYFDGEQWLRFQEDPNLQAAAVSSYPDEETEPFDEEEYFEEDEYFEEGDELAADETIIAIDDLEEFVEVVEVAEDDIIDVEEEPVEAEFQVQILKPEEDVIPAAAPVEQASQQPPAPQPAPSSQGSTAEVTPVQAQKTAPRPQAGPMPAAAAQPQQVAPGAALKAFPLWLWTSLGGAVTLFLAAAVIIGALYLLNNQEKAVAIIAEQQTPTLPAAVPQTTPTPAVTPTPTATMPPTPTPVPLTNFSSNYFGYTINYPAGWVFKEDDDLVIFAPSARSLDRTALNGASLWISLATDAELTDLLAGSLERFSPISETLNEGIMTIGRRSWASAQIRFNSETMGETIALIAATVINNRGYTLIAAAPAAEWEDFKPLFQYAIDSFNFAGQVTANVTPQTGATSPAVPATSQPTTPPATATATAPPVASAPVTYQVQAGDTLGGIALQFDVSVDDLVKANGLPGKDAIIRIGQELIIPGQRVAVTAATVPATPTPAETGVSRTATLTATVTRTAPTPAATQPPTATPVPAPPPTDTPPPQAALSGKIAYPAYSFDINSYNIWSVNVDGSDPLIIAANASQPKYSRDGQLFAYRSWVSSERGIYFVDYKGGRQGLLTHFVEDALPTWYTDGSLVFPSRREGDRVSRLFRVGQQGDNDIGLNFNSDYVDTMPDNRLVARGCTPSGDCGLWVLLPDGSGGQKISSDTSDTAPAAPPRGGRIAIMSFNRGGAENWEIWTINQDGSDPLRLTNNSANDGLPAWSPDGQSIAFVSDRGGVWAVWVVDAAGGEPRKLFDMQGSPDGQVLHDTSNSRGWLEERITWSP